MSAFDYEKARDVLDAAGLDVDSAWSRRLLDALAGCVTDDPRIAKLEALIDEVETARIIPWFDTRARAILRDKS